MTASVARPVRTISNARYVFRSAVDTDAYGAATAINTYPTLDGVAISYIDGASQAADLSDGGRSGLLPPHRPARLDRGAQPGGRRLGPGGGDLGL